MHDMRLLGTIDLAGEAISLFLTRYEAGLPAVVARDASGLPYGSLSVNPGVDAFVPDGCIAVKTWGEGEALAAAAAKAGLFEPTGDEIQVGYGRAPLWRLPA